MLLHGVPIHKPPRDLDIYVDQAGAEQFHEALADVAADEQQYNETEQYRSTLSHYTIAGVSVELVAGFVVRAPGAAYQIHIQDMLVPFARRAAVCGTPIGVMPLAHELLFNMLRGRPDRYEAIAETMRRDLAVHLPAMQAIAAANTLDEAWRTKIAALLGLEERFFDVARRDGYAQNHIPS